MTSLQDIEDRRERGVAVLARGHDQQARVRAAGCVLLCAGIGLLLVLAVTHQGPGLTPDSTAYVQSARSLAAGEGLQHFNGSLVVSAQTHFAPLFSVVLAVLVRAGATFQQGARWLNASLFAVNCVLLALVLSRCVDHRHALFAAIFGGILAGFSPVLIHVHGMVWSEPLFLTFMLGSFFLVGAYIDGGSRGWLIGGAVAAALAFLTRYAGATVVIGLSAALMERGPSGRKRATRIGDTVLFGIIACVPLMGWFGRNIAASSHAADRTIAFHSPLSSDFHQAIISLSDWILPTSEWPNSFGVCPGLPAAGAGLIAAVAIAAFITMFKHRDDSRLNKRCGTTHILLWFAPLYAVFILASMTWFDAATELDFRILCPLYVALMPMIAAAFFVLISRLQAKRSTQLQRIMIVAGLLVAFQCSRTVFWAERMRRHGLGYSASPWRHSGLIELARKLPDDALIYSNAPDALYLLADRLAKPIPKLVQPGSREESGTSAEMLKLMQHDLQIHRGYVLYFSIVGRGYFVSETRLLQSIRARHIYGGPDGTAFREKERRIASTQSAVTG